MCQGIPGDSSDSWLSAFDPCRTSRPRGHVSRDHLERNSHELPLDRPVAGHCLPRLCRLRWSWHHFLVAAAKAVKTTGVVLVLIGVSAMFQYLMGLYEVADFMGGFIADLSTTPWVVFLLINVILFPLGTIMDMAATILIATPIFLPIAMKYGMDPVQFGMVMRINCALGLNTPPVGTTQFVGCAIGGISVGQVMKTIWPFYDALVAALMLVTYVPAFSLALPRLLMGYAH